MYDFVFSVHDLRWPCDPPFEHRLVATDARQAWEKFETRFPFKRYNAQRMVHNMYNTSSLCE